MNPYMTEAEAWREVARRIADGKLFMGICFMIDALLSDDVISYTTWHFMSLRIREGRYEKENLEGVWRAYLWPSGECADERETYCLFMALLCEDGD